MCFAIFKCAACWASLSLSMSRTEKSCTAVLSCCSDRPSTRGRCLMMILCPNWGRGKEKRVLWHTCVVRLPFPPTFIWSRVAPLGLWLSLNSSESHVCYCVLICTHTLLVCLLIGDCESVSSFALNAKSTKTWLGVVNIYWKSSSQSNVSLIKTPSVPVIIWIWVMYYWLFNLVIIQTCYLL